MNKEIVTNVATKCTKESFIEHGIDHLMQPALSSLMESSKKQFAKMILDSTTDKYQFILTIKEIE